MDTASEQDESEYQPKTSKEDGSEYQPSSSREDGSDYEPCRPQKTNKHVETHRGPVALDQHHLRADTDLEVGTPISIGETLGRQNGSFPKITSCRHLLATASGTELVWIYETKEHHDNPECYLKSSNTKDVLHIRHLVLSNPEFASKSLPQFEATEYSWTQGLYLVNGY